MTAGRMVAVVLLLTALLLTLQLRTERTIRKALGVPSPQLEKFGYRLRRTEALRRAMEEEVQMLRGQVALMRRLVAEGEEGVRAQAAEVEWLSAAAGFTPLVGPGVVVEIRDSARPLSPDEDPNDALIHYTDLQALVSELWAAGAEGLAINGERFTPASSIQCVGTTVLVNRRRLTPPFRIEAIGDPAALRSYLLRADGTVPYLRAFAFPASVTVVGRLALPASRGPLPVGTRPLR